jgi:bifunctional UDP-N-acetylglucosamine pyrophosphorylase/glucosamine-1-phosphate N-acetyltransferase
MEDMMTASVVFAAGKGTRMSGFDGNKTLLPLLPQDSFFQGDRPLLIEVLGNLPPGPKAVVVNYHKAEVIEATGGMSLAYIEQPVTNGTGGALLAARDFLETIAADRVLITMGDVPLVKKTTYERLLQQLVDHDMAVLGFSPRDRGRYGALEIRDRKVIKITEWQYWKDYPDELRNGLRLFNAGIYAAKTAVLRKYLETLESNPHVVTKSRNGQMVAIEEFFITDLIEFLNKDGLPVGFVEAEDEWEVMGVDTPEALRNAQQIYARERC